MFCNEYQKIIPIACHDKKQVVVGVPQSVKISGRHGKRFPQFRHFMPLTTQHPRHFRWDIMIEEEPHDFCRIASRFLRAAHLACNQGVDFSPVVLVVRQAFIDLCAG